MGISSLNSNVNVNMQTQQTKQNKRSKWVAPTVGMIGGTIGGATVGTIQTFTEATAEELKWLKYIDRHKNLIESAKAKMTGDTIIDNLCKKQIEESTKQVASGLKNLANAKKAQKSMNLLKAIPKNPTTYTWLLTGLALGLIANHFINKKDKPKNDEGLDCKA